MTGAIHKGDMPQQSVRPSTSFSFARRIHFFIALEAAIASGPRTCFVVTLVDFGIGISQFDGDVLC